MPEQDAAHAILEELCAASAVINWMPEIPGTNGSLQSISDTDADRVGKALSSAVDLICELQNQIATLSGLEKK